MGKIKSKMVKRSAEELLRRGVEFNADFERNKKILGSNTMPSKKIRNQMAGYLVRINKREQKPQVSIPSE